MRGASLPTALGALILSTAAAQAAEPPATPAEVSVFKEGGAFVLRSSSLDLPIYTFDKDTPGRSNCVGPCAAAWPPVMAPSGARPFAGWTTVAREGGLQWAYKGKPVYTFARDTAAAPTGDGVGGVWRLAKP